MMLGIRGMKWMETPEENSECAGAPIPAARITSAMSP